MSEKQNLEVPISCGSTVLPVIPELHSWAYSDAVSYFTEIPDQSMETAHFRNNVLNHEAF